MSEPELELNFNRRAVRPVVCLREGWQLIKDDYWLFLGICIVGVLIASLVPLGILAGPMMCGINLCMLRRMRGRPVRFDMLFRGFDHFLPSLLAGLVPVVVTLALVPLYYVGILASALVFVPNAQQGDPPGPWVWGVFFGLNFLLTLLFSLVIVFFQMLVLFACPLIVERDLSAMPALRTSARAALANFFGLFALLLLNGLMSTAGLMACYVGAIFVLPLSYAAFAVAYRQVFPLQRNYEHLPYDEFPGDERPEREIPKDVLLVKDAIQAPLDERLPPESDPGQIAENGSRQTGIQGEPARDPLP